MSTAELIAKGKLRARRRNRAVRKKLDETTPGTTLRAPCRTNSQRGSTDFNARSYPPVASISRALHVLRAVNKFRIAAINDVYVETKIPKPTIVRVLETLICEGYVARDNLCGGYRVTSKAGELGCGYNGIPRIVEAARPIAIALTERTEWPVGIGTIDKDAIWLQFSTAALCRRANAVSLGWRLDMFYTAMGRAYLAFCPEAEREQLFRQRLDSGVSKKRDEREIRVLLPQIRQNGFAVRGENRTVVTSSVATPIFNDGVLLAVMNLSYFKETVPPEEMRARIVEPLLEATADIERAIRLTRPSGHA